MGKHVLAGVCDSDGSRAAAAFAARLAHANGAPLQLLHVYEEPFLGYGPRVLAGTYTIAEPQAQAQALALIAQETRRLAFTFPGLTVMAQIREGDAARVLSVESRKAAITVLGPAAARQGHGASPHSIPATVAAHGHHAVVIVNPGGQEHGPVLVGVDGTRPGQAAVGFAVRQALALDVPLVAINVYAGPATEAEELLRMSLLPWETVHPQLRTVLRPIHSASPEYAMADESQHASLTVVGSHGHAGYLALLLGSVSQHLVREGTSPVAIVHVP
ncbi:universal stress protein [Catelliglobosispora koreensis]|uniref:universal stress protein n=1 Tax=Catelliglobosispora koreensis TaxID=129052 RepID=UPI00035F7D8D|nr:universal stress protein [Catelliglobosispora koreensis]